jgi:DtxR family Mn-dependent transcriptional regulator
MRRALEEILESMWKVDENKETSTEAAVRNKCPDDIEAEDLQTLEKQGFVTRDGDLITLTENGRKEAEGVVRRHRLAEVLFSTMLNIDAEKREKIACEVEHTLVPEMEEAICTLLGHPVVCPDGKPIPRGRCCFAHRTVAATVIVSLADLKPGEKGRIMYIKPKHHARFHRLTAFGLTPGTLLEVHQKFPAFCVRYEGTELALNRDAVEDIFVARVE